MKLSKKFILEPHFFAVLAGLALPIALQDLVKFSLSLADNIMVGSLSETALGAVTLASQPFFIFSMLSFGIASGGGVLVAQYYGKHDSESIQKIVSITISIGIFVSFLFGLVTTLCPQQVMRVFTNVPELIDIGAEYLRIQGFAYFFYGFSNTMIMLMRSTREVKAGLIVNLSAFLFNVFLNWALIFGHLGFPALGVKGAAIGTVIARAAECFALLVYMRFMERHLHFRFKKLFHFDRILFRDFFALQYTGRGERNRMVDRCCHAVCDPWTFEFDNRRRSKYRRNLAADGPCLYLRRRRSLRPDYREPSRFGKELARRQTLCEYADSRRIFRRDFNGGKSLYF